jgi:signal transduction histidine kinase
LSPGRIALGYALVAISWIAFSDAVVTRLKLDPFVMTIKGTNVERDEVQVTVKDAGTGLDPTAMDRIFDPFYTTMPGGMGMGLSICRSIVQAHGGRLWATAGDCPGTMFHFTLPKYREGEPMAEERERETTVGS